MEPRGRYRGGTGDPSVRRYMKKPGQYPGLFDARYRKGWLRGPTATFTELP